MLFVSPVDRVAIVIWIIALVLLAVFSVRWGWAFYRQSTDNPNPVSAGFMIRDWLLANLFISFSGVIALYVFGVPIVTPIVWGTASTVWLLISYVILQLEINRQKRRNRK